jgi:tetratricopeptide (TPR) repeat protein
MVKPTAFEAELAGIDKHLAQLEREAAADPEKATKFAYRLYHRASLTGNYADFERVQRLLNELIESRGPREDLCLLRANLHFKWHRHSGVKKDFALCPKLSERIEGRSLEADLNFQEGRYDAALAGYESLIAEDRTWDNLARLAHYWAKRGEAEKADVLFVEAEDELTAKEMRSFAWVELQRGLLDIVRGRPADALAHYRIAERAYPGFWFVDEHIAESLAMLGQTDEAIALYRSVLARVNKPEVNQALGQLYRYLGRNAEAEEQFGMALDEFLASAARGEVHYYHHLTELYANIYKNGQEALRWAEFDIAERENFATQAAMAWALYRCGRFIEAVEWSDKSLASGMRDAELLHQAAHIQKAAGNADRSSQLTAVSKSLNPNHHGFHVHH